MVTHTYNPGIWEAETEKSWVWGQPDLHTSSRPVWTAQRPCLKKKRKKNKNEKSGISVKKKSECSKIMPRLNHDLKILKAT